MLFRSLAVIDLGGGRIRKDDPIDHAAGLVIAAPVGSHVERGDPLVHVHAATEAVARRALPRLEAAWGIAGEPVAGPAAPHVRRRVDRDGIRDPKGHGPRLSGKGRGNDEC